MSEGSSSLQPSPYLQTQGNGIKISPSSMMRSNETDIDGLNGHGHGCGHQHQHQHQHLQGSELSNNNSNIIINSNSNSNSNNNSTGNISNSENSNNRDRMKGSLSNIESRQDSQSLSQNNHQNQSRSSSTAINLTMNMTNSQAQSQSQPPGRNEELPPRILLFSPSPDKVASPHIGHTHTQGHSLNHHYDRDDSNTNDNTNGSGNSCSNVNVNNNSNTLHQRSPPAHATSTHNNVAGKVSSSPSHAGHGSGEGSLSTLQHSHSNKPPTNNSRSNMALSSNGGNHKHDRLPVTNDSSSLSSLYGRRDHDSYDSYGGGNHTNLYNTHTVGIGGRRYPHGQGQGYEDSYQVHNHHDHHSQRHSSNDDYYDPQQNTTSTSHNPAAGASNSSTGPLDAGAASAPGVNNRTGGGGGGGAYSRQGMQASRLAYEQDLHNNNSNSNSNASSHHNNHQPPPTPSSGYHARYGNERRKEEIMKHYHPPQASPSAYDRYGHRPSTRFEMDHRRLPLLDIGGTTGDQRTGGGAGTSSTSGGATTGGGGVHSMDDNDSSRAFDGRTGGGYHVSPAVAISRRGGTKRSPYDQSEHMFSNDHHSHPSPPNIRNTSAVRYCTPIVTGSERSRLENGNLPQGGGQVQDDHLHHHAGVGGGGFGRTMNNGGPSPPSSRYDDHHDSHLRHYHRPYPSIRGISSSPPRYSDGSPQHHHHNIRGSPSHYATPVLLRGNSARDRPYYDPPHPHMPSSYHHREKENYSYPTVGGYHHPGAGFYSPYGNAMAGPGGGGRHPGHGHLDYHHSSSLHHPYPPNNNSTNNNNSNSNTHSKSADLIAAPPQKKQRRINADPDKPKTKSVAANKPPRRKKMYSDYVGVTYNKTHAKFQACITHYRKQHYLGRYKLAVDAARAYDKSAKELKGDGWKINFQSDEEYEKAKLKEISDTEKKKAAAAAKLLQEQEASKLGLTVDQQPGVITSSTVYDSSKLPAAMKPIPLPSMTKHVHAVNNKTNMDAIRMKTDPSTFTSTTSAIEHESGTIKNTSSSLKVDVKSIIKCISNATTNASSSAVTPSPHAQNLNNMNQASLMNEPLISPLPKVGNTNTPLVRKSVFSPTPVKQTVSQSDDTVNSTTSMREGEIEQKNTMCSSNHSSGMPIIINNIFSSPMEKQEMLLTATAPETKKMNSLLVMSTNTEENASELKKEKEGYKGSTNEAVVKQEDTHMPKVEEDENAAQALLMIRH